MQSLLNTLIDTLQQGHPAILGTVVASAGSAPRTSGARMLTLADGTLAGTVGGGVVEGACQAESKKMLENGNQYQEMRFDLTAQEAADSGMICGGAVQILLNRLTPADLNFFITARKAYAAGQTPILVTLLPVDGKPPQLGMVGQASSTIPTGIMAKAAAHRKRVPMLIKDGASTAFVESLVHPGTVYITGAGHVGLATAELAHYVGFEMVVMDDRSAFASSERFPQAKAVQIIPEFAHCFPELGADDYVVIVTRGHQYDRDVLAQALRTGAGYIGMIGSSKKRQAVYDSLLQMGFTQRDLQRVVSPIGLAIGSDTPQEIGLAIVAQLVQARAAKRG